MAKAKESDGGRASQKIMEDEYKYEIYFYQTKDGKKPVEEYIMGLAAKKETDKTARIHLNKIQDYINVLRKIGLSAGEPYVKIIEKDLFELRPLNDRIFFAYWTGKSFVLLHHFVKKTQKTPPREIRKAKNCLEDMKRRLSDNGK